RDGNGFPTRRSSDLGVAQDYFRTKESKKEVNVVEEAQIVEPVGSEAMMDSSIDSQERVTVYDDDTMPYSFLWWLHKTRLEYAERSEEHTSALQSREK